MPPPHNPNVPHHDLDDEAEIRHLDIDYRLTATAVHCAPVAAGTSTPPPGEPRQPAAWSAPGAETGGSVGA